MSLSRDTDFVSSTHFQKMPPGSHLSSEEERLVVRLHDYGFRNVAIGEDIGRSKKAVQNVLRNPERTRPLPRSGQPTTLSPAARRLLREAMKQQLSAPQLNF